MLPPLSLTLSEPHRLTAYITVLPCRQALCRVRPGQFVILLPKILILPACVLPTLPMLRRLSIPSIVSRNPYPKRLLLTVQVEG